MKLWAVIILMGQVGGTWGPLPYGIEECERRTAEVNTRIERAIQEHKADPKITVDNTFQFCHYSSQRPALGTPVEHLDFPRG